MKEEWLLSMNFQKLRRSTLSPMPHANVVFHRNEKHFGNTIQVNATGDTLTIIANIIWCIALLYLQLADLDLSGGAQPKKVVMMNHNNVTRKLNSKAMGGICSEV